MCQIANVIIIQLVMKYKYIGYEKRKRAYMKILKILFLIKTILRLIISLNAITKLN